MQNFSIDNILTPTNKDVTVTFTPDSGVTKYIYTIYDSDTPKKTIEITGNSPSNIYLTETGVYHIEVVSYKDNTVVSNLKSGQYIVDKTAPVLDVGESEIELHEGEQLLVDEGVYATDNFIYIRT
jgi:hypothetical protein